MDITAIGAKILDFIKKYRFVLIILAVGVVFMIFPTQKKESTDQNIVKQTQPLVDPSEELSQILSRIQGAGKVEILLTRASGERNVYQTNQERDESEQGQSIRVETVIITDADRAQQGLLLQILAPEYRGAIVVCQGADNAAVRLAIIEAVADATGLGTDRISVLKMK